MQVELLAAFVLCVAIASVLQSLTTFAFGLVLLGLVELFRLVPLSDATNASMVLALVNSLAFFWGDRKPPPWREVRPAIIASVVGVASGLALQQWLSAGSSQWMRLMLGVVVVASALNLVFSGKVRAQPSPPASYAAYGWLSGLLGGLFATSGPPMVYHMLRQPLDPVFIRRCLVLVFIVNNASRLVMVAGTGQLSGRSLVLCAVALPVAFIATRVAARWGTRLSRRRVVALTGVLLCATGFTLAATAIRAMRLA